jgi:hypothetical protein
MAAFALRAYAVFSTAASVSPRATVYVATRLGKAGRKQPMAPAPRAIFISVTSQRPRNAGLLPKRASFLLVLGVEEQLERALERERAVKGRFWPACTTSLAARTAGRHRGDDLRQCERTLECAAVGTTSDTMPAASFRCRNLPGEDRLSRDKAP